MLSAAAADYRAVSRRSGIQRFSRMLRAPCGAGRCCAMNGTWFTASVGPTTSRPTRSGRSGSVTAVLLGSSSGWGACRIS